MTSTKRSAKPKTKAAGGGAKCATEGCAHPRDLHSIEGRTCWGDIACPCSHFAVDADQAEAVDRSLAAGTETIEGGPTIAADLTPDSDLNADATR